MYSMSEDGRIKTERTKHTWRSTFKEDLDEMVVNWHGAHRIASDRERWTSSPGAPRGTGGPKSK